MKSKRVTTEKLKEEEKRIDIESIITQYLFNVKITEEYVKDTIKKGYMNPTLAREINETMDSLHFHARFKLLSLGSTKADRDKLGEPWKINMKPKEETPLPYMS
jgi:hypothetical protein